MVRFGPAKVMYVEGGGVVDGSQVWWVGVGGGVAGPAGLDHTVGSSSTGQRNQDVPVCLGTVRIVLQQVRVIWLRNDWF